MCVSIRLKSQNRHSESGALTQSLQVMSHGMCQLQQCYRGQYFVNSKWVCT